MELTKNIIRRWKADSEESVRNGSAISEWFEGRISVYDFLLTMDIPEGDQKMTEFEMLEYIKAWVIVNADNDGKVDARELRKEVYSVQKKMPAFGYDVPDGVFD